MGMDLITVGFTTKDQADFKAGDPAFKAHLAKYREQLLENINSINESGQFDDNETEDFLAAIEEGAHIVLEGTRMDATYRFTAQDGEQRWFVIMGGGSWGDDPFEGFSSVCMFVSAVEVLPEDFRKPFAVYGAGIVTA